MEIISGKHNLEPVMEVFSTDVIQTYPPRNMSKNEVKSKKFISFNLLPIRTKPRLKKSSPVTDVFLHDITNCSETNSDKTMLRDNLTSSSDHDDEGIENGLDNVSFDNEVSHYAVLYKAFGDADCIKDAPSVQCIGQGKCVITDLLKSRLLLFSKSGVSKLIMQNDETIEPWGIAFHENLFLVTSRRKRQVIKLTESGDIDESCFGDSLFQDPCGIAVTKDHKIIVSDILLKKVSTHDWSGNYLYELCPPNKERFKLPRYITASPLGDIIISDSGNHCIYIFSINGIFKKTFGSYGTGDGQFKAPYGVCCDHFGNIYVADHYNDRISFFSKDGEFVDIIITKKDGIFHPQGISLSPDMKLFVTHGSLRACEVKVFSLLSGRSKQIQPDTVIVKI